MSIAWLSRKHVSFQILSSTTSVQMIDIQGTRGMIIGHVNSTRVKHFVGTKLLRNTGKVSSAVTQNTMEVPASQQNVTQSKDAKSMYHPIPQLYSTPGLTVQLPEWHLALELFSLTAAC